MKTVKSALLGTRNLIDTNDKVILVQISGILKQHRELIIDRLLKDIPTYVAYKFNVMPDKNQKAALKGMLIDLKNSAVDITYYKTIIMKVLSESNTQLTNEPFYLEIDEKISQCLNSNELPVVQKQS